MRIGRMLLIAGVILVVGAIVIGGIIVLRNRQAKSSATPPPLSADTTPGAAAPLGLSQIVLAAQNIPRGTRITADNNAVVLGQWPDDALPQGVIASLDNVYGRIARVDIVLGMPVLEASLTDKAGNLGAVGSDAALRIPAGMVAYAIPSARYSSAAWALRPGDRIDVILSLLMSDLDEEFQTQLVNSAVCLTSADDPEACAKMAGKLGRTEVLPNGWLVNITPNEEQRARLVTQLTLQNVLVLQVGDWPESGAAPEAAPTPVPVVEGEAAPTPAPAPEVIPLTLAVTQQDALVLEYAQAVGARFTFALRSAGDSQSVATESVTLQYLMDRFSIELPPKLPYGVNPPLRELERIGQGSSVGTYGSGSSGASAAAGQ